MRLKTIPARTVDKLYRISERAGEEYVTQAREQMEKENPCVLQFLQELSLPDWSVVEHGLLVYQIIKLALGKNMPIVRQETLDTLLENMGRESEQEVVRISDDKVSEMESYAEQMLRNKYIKQFKEEQLDIYEELWQNEADPVLLFNAVESTVKMVVEDLTGTRQTITMQKEYAKRTMLAAAGVYYLVKTEYEKIPERGLLARLRRLKN